MDKQRRPPLTSQSNVTLRRRSPRAVSHGAAAAMRSVWLHMTTGRSSRSESSLLTIARRGRLTHPAFILRTARWSMKLREVPE